MAIDVTTGRFHISGMRYVAFHEIAGSGVQDLISKEFTVGQNFIIEQVMLACLTGHVFIFDGTAGGTVPIFALHGGGQDITTGWATQTWDFRGDPIELTRDGTALSICAVGTFSGFVKYGWGTK